jgi:hypothetical protein
MSDEQTRRSVLKTGAVVGSLGVTASLSGCSGGSDDGNTDNETDGNTDNETDGNTSDNGTDGNTSDNGTDNGDDTEDSDEQSDDDSGVGSDPVAPNTLFAYDYNRSGNQQIVVRVRDGDTFNSDQVSFRGDIAQDGQTWTDLQGSQSTVTAGDSVTLDATSDEYLLELIWTAESGENTFIIGVNTGPDRAAP